MSLSNIVGSVVRKCLQTPVVGAPSRVWLLQGSRNFSAGNNLTESDQCVQHQFAESYVRIILALGTKDLANTHPNELQQLNALYTQAIHTQGQDQGQTGDAPVVTKMTSDRIFPHEVLAQNTFSGSDLSTVQDLSAAEAKKQYINLTRKIIGY